MHPAYIVEGPRGVKLYRPVLPGTRLLHLGIANGTHRVRARATVVKGIDALSNGVRELRQRVGEPGDSIAHLDLCVALGVRVKLLAGGPGQSVVGGTVDKKGIGRVKVRLVHMNIEITRVSLDRPSVLTKQREREYGRNSRDKLCKCQPSQRVAISQSAIGS